jgi:LPS export ABC transporter protein LptC
MAKKIVILFVLAVVCVFMSACTDDDRIKPRLPVGGNIEDIPNYIIEGFALQNSIKGKTDWEITGKGAQVFELKKKIYVQDFLMKNYDDSGKYSTLTGKKGLIYSDTNNLEISDDVVYKAVNGMILKTRKLYWDNALKRMHTDDEVIIIKGSSILKGIGLESDASMKNMVIKKQVRLTAKDIQEAEKK